MNIPGLTDMQRPDAAAARSSSTATTASQRPAAVQAASRLLPTAAVAGATGQETGIKAGVTAIAEPFDAAKVERIKTAIRNGEFQTSSAAVAHKLLASVHELFRPAH